MSDAWEQVWQDLNRSSVLTPEERSAQAKEEMQSSDIIFTELFGLADAIAGERFNQPPERVFTLTPIKMRDGKLESAGRQPWRLTAQNPNLETPMDASWGCQVQAEAMPLAKWFCRSFWRILEEPGIRRREGPRYENWLNAHAMPCSVFGKSSPSVTFVPCGERVIIKHHPTDERGIFAPKLCLQEDLLDFLQVISDNIDGGLPDLQPLREDFFSDGRAECRKIEAKLGYFPKEAPNQLLKEMRTHVRTLGPACIAELAEGINPANAYEVKNQKDLLQEALEGRNGGRPARMGISRQPIQRNPMPWLYGRALARQVRQSLSIGSGEPISQTVLMDCAGISKDDYARIVERDEVALCPKRGNEVMVHFTVPRGSHSEYYSTRRRFQLAKTIGAWLIADPDTPCLALSKSMSWVQQAARNFAVEFLAPLAGVKEIFNGASNYRDADTAANKYGVSPRTIIHSAVNQGLLPRWRAEKLLAEQGSA